MPHSIDDYARDPQLAMIDAAADPWFRQFIEPTDIELVPVNLGGGVQAQAQALARGAVRRVIDRILAKLLAAGIDLKNWICSRDEFDLCSKLNTPIGDLMRQLHDSLRNRFVECGQLVLGVVGLKIPILGTFLLIFSGVAFINNAILELCDCPRGA
jgi:hypothetical protein